MTVKTFWPRLLFVIAALVTLVALFYAFENWRGKRAWRAYERQLQAQGIALDFRSLLPPHIPAESNFAATPFFADLFRGKPSPKNSDDRWPDVFQEAQRKATLPRTKGRQLTDLVAWQTAFRAVAKEPPATNTTRADAAREVLAKLKVYDPVLEELRGAMGRPLSRYLVNYDVEIPWSILLPHLPVVQRTSQMLGLKNSAELATGNNEQAFKDLLLHLRIADSLQGEPFLVSHLVRMAAFHLAMQSLWEGMVLDRWSDAQLTRVQGELSDINFVANLQKGFRAERSAAAQFVDLVRKQQHQREFLEAMGLDPDEALLLTLLPEGWIELERRNYVEMFQTCFFPPLDPTNHVIKAGLAKASQRTLEQAGGRPLEMLFAHRLLARLLLPALESVQSKTAFAQATAHQAVIACALERHRIAKKTYPTDLEALEPDLKGALPADPVNGGAMRYKAGMVYSVGWDEKDDGGTQGTGTVLLTGDWVWKLPAK